MIRLSTVPAVTGLCSRALRGAASRSTKGATGTTLNKDKTQKPTPGLHEDNGTRRLLAHYRVDLETVFRKYPSAFCRDVTKTEATVEVLTRHNIDIRKALGRRPQLLSMPPEMLKIRLTALKDLFGELRMPFAVSKWPALLCLQPNTLDKKLIMLASLGFDAQSLSGRYPLIFTISEYAIRNRIAFFEELGLDALKIINGMPQVVANDIQRTLRPLIAYITKDMGRSLVEINRCPRCFSTSLEYRLKPRHEYLKQHGRRQDYSLNSLCALTDARFVLLLIDRSQEDYRRWLATRFQ